MIYVIVMAHKCFVHDGVYVGFHGSQLELMIQAQRDQFHGSNSHGLMVIKVK